MFKNIWQQNRLIENAAINAQLWNLRSIWYGTECIRTVDQLREIDIKETTMARINGFQSGNDVRCRCSAIENLQQPVVPSSSAPSNYQICDIFNVLIVIDSTQIEYFELMVTRIIVYCSVRSLLWIRVNQSTTNNSFLEQRSPFERTAVNGGTNKHSVEHNTASSWSSSLQFLRIKTHKSSQLLL